ncbi:MAG: anhydro-N-acetylmuramic acid kinase [Flavobacterium sp.]|nr:anhydro-N-acetylmuramic acid kinase [Flavobacterium sp.]
MRKQTYNVIGVMSGTSLDGIDLAEIKLIFSDGKWTFEISQTETVAYEDSWLEILRSASSLDQNPLAELDTDYTTLLASVIKSFVDKNNLVNIDAVCSHGHTVLHQPQNKLTLQIGNLPEISKLIGYTVVCDFRVADVALGGQGAPLVPIGDRLLFSKYDYCMNLGGFSNVSFEHGNQRIAFDICPVNTVLNNYANELGMPFDDGGKTAASGELNEELLHQLNTLEFYKLAYPKSLGIEYVNKHVLPLIETAVLPAADKLRTFTEHIALQISLALPEKSGSILITGGGAYNTFLMERLKYYLPEMDVEIPDPKILEYKEALIFALLGVLKLRNENNVLASVTGASRDHSSGKIFLP